MAREPVVAGQFYAGTKERLEKELKALMGQPSADEDALGIVSPHAGYVYSGAVAGAVFACARPKSVYIILGPNHTGLGGAFSLSQNASWRTPLGEVRIDERLALAIKNSSRYVKVDDLAHMHEHSIEVQLPFLQYRQGSGFSFVPIVISYARLEVYQEIGHAIAKAVKELKIEAETAIIASTDMTHYEPQETAVRKDSKAIEAILALDESSLVNTVSGLDISMCGYAPTAIMIAAARELGAKTARLVKYQTSGDSSGDYSSVVGYAGIIITRDR